MVQVTLSPLGLRDLETMKLSDLAYEILVYCLSQIEYNNRIKISQNMLVNFSSNSEIAVQLAFNELVSGDILWDRKEKKNDHRVYMLNFKYGWVGDQRGLQQALNEICDHEDKRLTEMRYNKRN